MTGMLVDALFDTFLASLEDEARPAARALAHRLGLAPHPAVPWSEVFAHEVTLGAPSLVAEAFPRAEPARVRQACLAHMLAVIEAFGTDRMIDGQVAADEALLGVLRAARGARDQALAALGAGGDYGAADRRSWQAMATERGWLATRSAVDQRAYAEVSLGKQAVGFEASLALARSAGARPRELATLERLLGDVWLGLQHHDDVVDWEDDWANGGAWAVCLALAHTAHDSPPPSDLPGVRSLVLRSGVLLRLLTLARRRFGAAARRARALGARRLARWAAEREGRLSTLCRAEARSAGFAVRQRRLLPFAAAVLS